MTLEIGYNHPVEIRDHSYPFEPLQGKRILYISDLHYHRRSHRRVSSNIELIRKAQPDMILLGGDYVDTPWGLPHFQHLVESIGPAPIFAIAGNHDRPYLRRIRQIVENAGAVWLHKHSTTLGQGSQRIQIDGTHPAALSPHHGTDVPPFSILCLHHPIDVRPLAHRYHLIFAGHLHGGQIVLWQTSRGLYPARWVYPWNQLDINYGHCRYIISKGLGDTLPIRYRCRRDVIIVTLTSNQHTP